MKSPLEEFYNTILFLPGEQTLTLDGLGNPSLMPAGEIEYKTFLKAKRDPNREYSVGVNSHKQYFSGYVVEPMSLPDSFELPATVRCKIRRGKNDLWIAGSLEIMPRYMSIDIPEDVLGDAISGYFYV